MSAIHDITASNTFEALLFSLSDKGVAGARPEVFAINVFKIREVFNSVPVTRIPGASPGVTGMISLRGEVLSVVDLSKLVYEIDYPDAPHMMVTEFAGFKQVFLIHGVNRIIKINWADVHPVEAGSSILLTGVAKLEDDTLVSLLDVEQVLAKFVDFDTAGTSVDIPTIEAPVAGSVFFVDDSLVARKQIEKTLSGMGLRHQSAINGAEAWTLLQQMANAYPDDLKQHIALILTDVEMPELDGYQLTRKIKEDNRFKGIPVLMYSSLTQGLNAEKGKQVGADYYVQKFDAGALASALAHHLK